MTLSLRLAAAPHLSRPDSESAAGFIYLIWPERRSKLGELRNCFRRLAFNGLLTPWGGSGLAAAWKEHLLSGK